MIFKPFLFRFRDGVELSHLLGVAALNTQVSAITGSFWSIYFLLEHLQRILNFGLKISSPHQKHVFLIFSISHLVLTFPFF
jgi:hypothetical protein